MVQSITELTAEILNFVQNTETHAIYVNLAFFFFHDDVAATSLFLFSLGFQGFNKVQELFVF